MLFLENLHISLGTWGFEPSFHKIHNMNITCPLEANVQKPPHLIMERLSGHLALDRPVV